MSKKTKLEQYIAEKLKKIDKRVRPTRASGASTEIGDIYSNYFFVECKEKHTNKNIIMDYNKEYLKLINQMPVNTKKEAFIAIENKSGEKFIVMEAEAFFRLVYRAFEGKEK